MRKDSCLFLLVEHTALGIVKNTKVQLDVAPGSLLIFRHDAYVHSYKPRSADLILQAASIA
eukprot:5384346-Amphidinium_carterae.2